MNAYIETLETALKEFIPLSGLEPGKLLVIGCSTSEILGQAIGQGSNRELGEELYRIIEAQCLTNGIFPAFQCCEHLNRALVISREAAERCGLTEVTVIPVPGAGGSLAAAAYKALPHPVVVESIQAHAGIDIGDTFIGMHLKPVAVPIRINIKQIGQAHLTLARTRPKLIGGNRAFYGGQMAEARSPNPLEDQCD